MRRDTLDLDFILPCLSWSFPAPETHPAEFDRTLQALQALPKEAKAPRAVCCLTLDRSTTLSPSLSSHRTLADRTRNSRPCPLHNARRKAAACPRKSPVLWKHVRLAFASLTDSPMV